LLSALADNNWPKTRFGGFFYDRCCGYPQDKLVYLLFFGISRIASPQSHQNLVNYHPILCPNIGEYSIFVRFLSNDLGSPGWVTNHLAGHVAGSSKNSEYTWRFSWLSLPTNVR